MNIDEAFNIIFKAARSITADGGTHDQINKALGVVGGALKEWKEDQEPKVEKKEEKPKK